MLNYSTEAGGLPFDIQMHLILFLDLGRGTPDDPGYITPFCWVCKAWSQQIRRRVYRRCNVKSSERMDWFLKSVHSSVVPLPGNPGVGQYITILSISFVPPGMGSYLFPGGIDSSSSDSSGSDSGGSDSGGSDSSSSEVKYDLRDYWERLTDAVQNMEVLHTLCLCYNNDPLDYYILDAYSRRADAFPPSLKTLILRPLKNTFVSN